MVVKPNTRSLESTDVQARPPATRVSLSRVGVTGVEKIIRVSGQGGGQLYHAEIECYVDLNPEQSGVHMSRFQEVVNEAIDEVIMSEALQAEALASHIAERVRERQGGARAEVTMRARYPENKLTPVTEKPTQELYTLIGAAVASDRGVRRLIGVEASGITACPCAQQLVSDAARVRLAEQGFSTDEIERILSAVPVATHNQRGTGMLLVGCPEDCDVDLGAETLLAIVEQSMSSEIFELMKRPDERAVVEKAHSRPRFVEDCVREMVRGLVERYPDLPGGAFVMARQENLETIHQHNAVAERYGLLADLRLELGATAGTTELGGNRHLTMREWLESSTAQ